MISTDFPDFLHTYSVLRMDVYAFHSPNGSLRSDSSETKAFARIT